MDTAMAADGMQEEDIGSMVLSRFSDSPRSADQNLCAVVGTMCQELKERGIPLTPVAYFGAAASTLDRLTQDSSSGPDPKTKALLTFLSVVLPAVPAAAVRCKGGEVAGTLVRILGFSTLSEGSTKAALKCLALVIANGDKSNWVQGIQPRYDVLLGFVADTREKVRREAHMCLCDILRHFQGTPVLSPASERIINLLRKRSLLSKPMNDVNANISQVAGALEVLFTLNALTECLPLMTNTHKNRFLSSCMNLLKHIETPVLTRAIMAALHSLSCSSVPDTSAGNMLGLLCSISVSICGSEKSADALAATARMLHVGVKKVYDLNRSTCIEKLPLIFSTLADIMACEHEEAIFAAAEAFKGLIYSCIDDTLIQEGVDWISSNVEGGLKRSVPTLIERICISMEGLLGYQYVAVWDLSFQIISSMFDRLGESSCHLMVGVIESLANLENLSDEDLVYRKQLHECVGSAVAALGPETFLKILPLNLEYDELSKANMWLLPILKQYIVGARLSYFTESIFMVIKLVQQRSQKFESEGLIVSARTAQGIVFSLWSLLPAFCNYPSDMASSFKSLQKVLRDKLQEEPDLRGLICSSLQILIQQNKKVLEGNDEPLDEQNTFLTRAKSCYTPQLAEENFNQLRSTATSFLSVLSKIFLNSSKDTGGCLLSTIKEFACISERKSVKLFFKNTMQRLLEVTQQAITAHQSQTTSSMQIDGSSNEISLSVKRALLLDLAVSVLPGLDDKEIDFLFNCIKSTIESEEAIIQKKAYKTLSVILKERDDFFSNKLDDIFELMVTVLPSCHFSAKRHRLECLYFLIVHVIKDTSEQRKPEVMSSFLTEIILALKEGNKKTRNKAYDLLVEIAHACGDEKQGGKKENLQQFFNMVAGGLAGETPHMISAAVKGLARLTYEFSELVGAACNLLPSSLLLLQRKNREICKANLGLVKVLVAKSQVDWLNTHLKGIVEGLLSWQDSKNHFKAKVKLLLEMLIKKCGPDAVKTVMPNEHMKLLTNIRKTTERNERKVRSEKGSMCSSSTLGKSHLSKTNASRLSRWNHTHIFSDVDDGGKNDSNSELVGYDENAASRAKSSSGLRSNANLMRLKRKRKSSKSLLGDSIEDMEHGPLDLLDMQKTRSALRSSQLKSMPEDNDEFEITADGRIVITEDKRKVKKERTLSAADSDARSQASGHTAASSGASLRGKRRKTADSGWAYTGTEYTSKKAKGDVKRKGKLEPYAYWPLDRKLLNRREESKAMARKGMATVVKMTKKLEGKSAAAALSLKGMKLKRTNRNKKHK